MSVRGRVIAVVGVLLLPLGSARGGEEGKPAEDWVGRMKEVHRRFTGTKGTFAHFGDSITITMAFWTPLLYARKNAPVEMEKAFERVKKHLRPECWREWKGPKYGNQGSMTIRWAHENIDGWLRKLNPEVALIMFGTNDLHALELEEYRTKMREVVRRCLDSGTVVILSTIPPRHGYAEKGERFAQAARDIARELKVPLTDFHAEVIRRRPDDWDGQLDKFKEYKGYDVPTLLARDGVHPSHPARYRDDYSEDALNCCGYSLRNYLVLMKYAEVLEKVLAAPPQDQASALRNQPWFPKAPPLPPPKGEVIRVSNVDELFRAAGQVKPGGTIFLADGHYRMPRYLILHTDKVTLRGESGDRDRVVLDGASSSHGELLGVSRCSGVTIADLTIQNVTWNGFKINSETGVQRLTIRNCVIHNIWQRGVKGVRVPPEEREKLRPRGCVVEYCLFYNDRAKRLSDDPADTPDNFNGDYVGGIDVMYPTNWVIRDNVFIGIQGRTRQARGAVFLWHDARDCVVERNIIIDCDAGICLGNSSRGGDTKIHSTGCIVRNNFITRAPESGILADYTRDCRIVSNTVCDPENRLGRLIRIVHDNDGLFVANNLLNGPKIRNESESSIGFVNNLEMDLSAFLVNPATGDLHLTARATAAMNRAVMLREVGADIDGDPRGPQPDIGADEFPEDGRM